MAKKEIFILCLIIILAAFLRLLALDRFPAGFTADEAAQGYTAYSILKTGKDEWGVSWPINPRSFGDYKLPLQTYLMIPSIAVLGLNELAVRLPNAILGALAVLATYFLVKELFPTRRCIFGLLAALFLAISPWHISLSRGAFEANLTTFFLPLGFYLFLKGLKESRYLIFAVLLFCLNLFSYHSARFLTPIFLGFLIRWKRKELSRLELLIFAIFFVAAIISFLFSGMARVVDISIFSAGWQAPKIFLDNYFSYLSLRFLFSQGPGEATYGMIPGRGLLYLFELPFLITALWSLAHKWNKNFSPLLVWLLLAPVPAALSFGIGYHANRGAVMMPAIQILSAYGGVSLWQLIKEWLGKKAKIVSLLYYFIAILSIGSFLKAYFFDAPKISAPAMAYGWGETARYLKTIENQYQKVIISRRFSEPQAFIAFYKKWEPADFQKEAGDWLRYQKDGLKFIDQLGNYHLGKYEFRNLNWNEDQNLTKTLLVGKPEDFPADAPIKKMIIYPDGERAFYIVDSKRI